MTSLEGVLPLLAGWMPHQRWYAAKSREPRLRLVDERELAADDASARVLVLLVADGATLYQVPLAVRGSAPAHVVGTLPDGRVVVDGPHDPAYTRALLAAVAGTGRDGARVLTGEQSNTSIIYPAAGEAPPVICKVFRQVHPGVNPDIELQTALTAGGCRYVPAVAGHLDGSWTDGDGERRSGSLAFAQEFLPGVEDAWRVALGAARRGDDFGDAARDLGRAVAAVHADLARVLGGTPAGDDERSAVVRAWDERLALACAEVGALGDRADRIRAVYAAAAGAAWPALQRVHGDLHLGQVILVPGRGWVLLDFEGEPLRPIAERRLPDLAVRDLAGMLRSFDYVAGALAHEGHDASAWARDARDAFLDGYGAVDRGLLAAFELDKAVYEVLYEARNRPDWIDIPLAAVERLTGQPA